jgi:hypothetical protein
MARFRNPLDHVRVASPCESDWDQMIGDERVRFCGQCSLNVYNLSSMTRADAESLIARTEGRLCVRFYRRCDGSIITKDCPVGLRAIRRRVSYIAKAIGSMVLGLFAGLSVHKVLSISSVDPFAPPSLMGTMVRRADPPAIVVGPPITEEGRVLVENGRMHVKSSRHRTVSGGIRRSSSSL